MLVDRNEKKCPVGSKSSHHVGNSVFGVSRSIFADANLTLQKEFAHSLHQVPSSVDPIVSNPSATSSGLPL